MLLFCIVVGVLLAGSYAILYTLVRRQAHSQLDRLLLETANPVVADLASDPTENDVDQLDLAGNYFELFDASGRTLQKSRNLGSAALALDGRLPARAPTFQTLSDTPYGRLRVALVPFKRGGANQILALAIPTLSADHALESFRHIIFWVFPLSLLLTALISGWYASRSLEPVRRLTGHAARMAERAAHSAAGELWTPLPVANPHDELGRLAATFNRLFASVDAGVRQLRQFVTDASHELRTPLSVLQGEAEFVLLHPRTEEEYQKALGVIHGELKTLIRIVNGLFTLSMADAGELRVSRVPLYLDEVAEEACALADPLARVKEITIKRDLARAIPYVGDDAFLRQLFLVFLDNAVKYSEPRTTIQVTLARSDGFYEVRFEDRGLGIDLQHLPRIFDRFYRVPSTAEGETQSGGLGLAIAQAIAHAHGGLIECSSEPGEGSQFTVKLPAGEISDAI